MKRSCRWMVSVAAGALLAAASAGAQEAAKPAAPPEPVKTGAVLVTIVAPAKGTVKQATVYAKTQVVPGTVGQEIRIDGVPIGKAAITVDAMVEEAPKKEAKRHLGVAEVTVYEGAPQPARVELVAVADVDAYCLGCHPNPRDPNVKIKPGQIVRDIHASGREFPEKTRDKYLAENRRYHESLAKLEKEKKPHGLPMPLEERLVKVGGKTVKKVFYTCETCHTLHQATPWQRYARAGYRDKSDLCTGCHF